ncbi:hypothetical protein GCM10027443_09060 [Pontibacter brevis]
MAIVIILIGTVLLMAVLCGALSLLLLFEEKPHKEGGQEVILPSETCKPSLPDPVPVISVEVEPIAQLQPSVPQPAALQKPESINID